MMDMMGEEKKDRGGKSARMMALEKLLDFIAQSETKRALPPEPVAPEAPPSDELDDSAMGALAGLRDEDEV